MNVMMEKKMWINYHTRTIYILGWLGIMYYPSLGKLIDMLKEMDAA